MHSLYHQIRIERRLTLKQSSSFSLAFQPPPILARQEHFDGGHLRSRFGEGGVRGLGDAFFRSAGRRSIGGGVREVDGPGADRGKHQKPGGVGGRRAFAVVGNAFASAACG